MGLLNSWLIPEAELWGSLEGLKLCWSKNCRFVQVDSEGVCAIIKESYGGAYLRMELGPRNS